jgi:hypothetical protein
MATTGFWDGRYHPADEESLGGHYATGLTLFQQASPEEV